MPGLLLAGHGPHHPQQRGRVRGEREVEQVRQVQDPAPRLPPQEARGQALHPRRAIPAARGLGRSEQREAAERAAAPQVPDQAAGAAAAEVPRAGHSQAVRCKVQQSAA